MMRVQSLLVLSMIFGGCTTERDGTFVGNPNLSVRYVDNNNQVALGGYIDIYETILKDCEGQPSVDLGANSFHFDGAISFEQLQIPVGSHCGVFLVVGDLRVEFQDGAGWKSIGGAGLDLEIPSNFEAVEGEDYSVRLADENWLPSLAAASDPGFTLLNNDTAHLREIFLAGLRNSSGISLAPPN